MLLTVGTTAWPAVFLDCSTKFLFKSNCMVGKFKIVNGSCILNIDVYWCAHKPEAFNANDMYWCVYVCMCMCVLVHVCAMCNVQNVSSLLCRYLVSHNWITKWKQYYQPSCFGNQDFHPGPVDNSTLFS